ncbi:GpmA2 [Desulforapulum autotrophicum HRM2]|uniref:2,3-bisphosphoglycerate-independent phosphoglycerate mutase n=1 Tax=Desulforapulum autotrophicum (strain ATCC 43914 / DSM 3382 / VKM B-1955 / HRM2) TaxID=177437 RepID=C0QLF4_DESAH|nr:2,3-bisphosphoglycerate-independent phosphoglycerate mutase [Desulforapulum autotrophicum]ACN16258.1 GpmA2 [Desulforapulum autotrophicum HRM2]
MTTKPVTALIILDGWGINNDSYGNAVKAAKTPFLDQLSQGFPHTSLACSGNAVGLPDGIMGNSEVGHMNMGAGRRVFQDLVRIDNAIQNGSFLKDPTLVQAMETVKRSKTTLHLMGLVSNGGVHSQKDHLLALASMAHDLGVNTAIHCITDGRDTPPDSGLGFMTELENHLSDKPGVNIATICGRFYAMDRDTRWDRIETAYNLYTDQKGTLESDPVQAIKAAYDRGETDEFIKPILMGKKDDPALPVIKDKDAIVFFNFRADRAREITRAFTEQSFSGFVRKKHPALSTFVCMTRYDENFDLPVVFPPVHLDNVLGKVISDQGLNQLRIAETEKYAHVTYFFNGGDETIFPGEERVLIPSPREVRTYDQKPGMSADLIADEAVKRILSGKYDLVVLNFANMDMVGHTGIMEAAVLACETVDRCVKAVVEAVWQTQGTAMITADHGNAEQMKTPDGSPHTSHTLNEVPFILAGNPLPQVTLSRGVIGDIAPTILKVMNLKQPVEMTGTALF